MQFGVTLCVHKAVPVFLSFFRMFLSKHRYGQVIAVVGMNPNKRYQVSPDERAQLIREMVLDSDVARNVRVEGKLLLTRVGSSFGMMHLNSQSTNKWIFYSGSGIDMEIC